jgi:hypothetical protein
MAFSPSDRVDDVMRGSPKTIRGFLASRWVASAVRSPPSTPSTRPAASTDIDREAFLQALGACG